MSRKRRRKQQEPRPSNDEYEQLTPADRYHHRRYSLFSLFDLGVALDDESWYSVTPEQVAKHHARRCGGPGRVMVDACCGVGGNAIQFALAGQCERVYAVDVDANKIEMARENAAIYGVADKIEFICADFLQLACDGFFEKLRVDGVFVSPPWGGPAYIRQTQFRLGDMPIDGALFWFAARSISPNIGLFLPRNMDTDNLRILAANESLEVESNYLNNRCLAVTGYWGDFVRVAANKSKD